ncbi:MAG: hypothetical protein PHF25_08115 [Candidatus Margulisbacteria bacterium]|nr:hypothetical protein [Candidatus Margulisiibacteriota bacterium]
MDEFIKIRIEELKVLKENVLQKQREELAKIDVRIDELKNMLSSTGLDYHSDDKVDLETVNKVANVLKESKKPVAEAKPEIVPEEDISKKDSSMDFHLDIEETPKSKKVNSSEIDFESMLNDL